MRYTLTLENGETEAFVADTYYCSGDEDGYLYTFCHNNKIVGCYTLLRDATTATQWSRNVTVHT